MEISITEIWSQMTIAAKVIAIVLSIMSVAMVAVTVERFITYMLARGQSKKFAAAVASMLKERRLQEVIAAANNKIYKRAYLGRIVASGVEDFYDLRTSRATPPTCPPYGPPWDDPWSRRR